MGVGSSPTRFRDGVFVVITGYIDESYSGESPPRMFGLTCTMAMGSEWPWIEMAWVKCLEEKNASLIAQGRKPISRYHSRDINNFRGDFADWDGQERRDFCERLMRVFHRHEWGYEGYLLNLRDMIELIPETDCDPIGVAYDVLLKFLMSEIGAIIEQLPKGKITLFHERCDYDGVLLDSFNSLIEDETFVSRHCFTTIAPMGWENCIPLQPADLIAYENFKEGFRQLPSPQQRERRKILVEMLSMETFVPHAKMFTRENIVDMKVIFDAAVARLR